MSTPLRGDLISRKAAAKTIGIPPYTFDRVARRLGLDRYHVLNDPQVFYLRTDIEKINIIEKVSS